MCEDGRVQLTSMYAVGEPGARYLVKVHGRQASIYKIHSLWRRAEG